MLFTCLRTVPPNPGLCNGKLDIETTRPGYAPLRTCYRGWHVYMHQCTAETCDQPVPKSGTETRAR